MEKISKNFAWMAASHIVSSVCGIALFIYLARSLGPKSFGYLSYVFTLVFFLYNFIDMGLSTYGVRAIAKNKSRVRAYVSEIVSLRFIAASAVTLIFITAVSIFSKSHTVKALALESSLIIFSFALATEWAFQGLEDMGMVFVSFATTSVLQLCLIFLFIKNPADIFKAPIFYFIATLPVITIFLLRLKFTLRLKMADFRIMFRHLSGSVVIWLISIFVQVYNSLDVFMLGLFRPIEEVGYFTVSRRVTGSMAIFMVFLANAVLPRLSSSFSVDSAQFKKDLNKFIRLAGFITVFILMPIGLFNRFFIRIIMGANYLPASMPLTIMMVGLTLILFNLPYSTALIAGGLEKEVLAQAIVCAGLSIILNFILMPTYGMIGASISFVIVEAVALLWIRLIYKQRGSKW